MRNREGFTLVEVVVALVLLAVGMLGFQAATGRFVRMAATSSRRTVAAQIVEDRIERIRTDPRYATVPDRYREVDTPVPESPGLRRTTRILHRADTTATGVVDFMRITVRVEGTGLADPVARTISIGRP